MVNKDFKDAVEQALAEREWSPDLINPAWVLRRVLLGPGVRSSLGFSEDAGIDEESFAAAAAYCEEEVEWSGVVDRHMELLAEGARLPKKQIWCSMVDPKLPKGERFLGAVVVEAQSAAWAIDELNMRGLNLGGEIKFTEIPADKRIPDEWVYRVMNKEEAENCPVLKIGGSGSTEVSMREP